MLHALDGGGDGQQRRHEGCTVINTLLHNVSGKHPIFILCIPMNSISHTAQVAIAALKMGSRALCKMPGLLCIPLITVLLTGGFLVWYVGVAGGAECGWVGGWVWGWGWAWVCEKEREHQDMFCPPYASIQ